LRALRFSGGLPSRFSAFGAERHGDQSSIYGARCDFEAIPPGTYALAVIHDENSSGKLETNWLGIPTEGYGFSNDAKAVFGTPSFDAASFPYDGQTLDLTISLHY